MKKYLVVKTVYGAKYYWRGDDKMNGDWQGLKNNATSFDYIERDLLLGRLNNSTVGESPYSYVETKSK